MRLVIPAIVFLLGLFLKNVDAQNNGYQPTILPKDTTLLWKSPDKAFQDIIIIDCPGGPDLELELQPRDKSRYRYLPNYDQISVVSMFQAQTFNPSMFDYEEEFTLKDAVYEMEITIEMLNRVLHYFKSRNKTVYIIGASYGAFIIQKHLSSSKPEADKYIIMSGRLDVDMEMVAEHKTGNSGDFTEDGLIYIPDDDLISIKDKDGITRENLVKNRLKAAIGITRYTEALANIDFSNIIYIYSTNDQNVGTLKPDEIAFLEKKGAAIYADDRGHTKTWQRLIDEVRAGAIQF